MGFIIFIIKLQCDYNMQKQPVIGYNFKKCTF